MHTTVILVISSSYPNDKIFESELQCNGRHDEIVRRFIVPRMVITTNSNSNQVDVVLLDIDGVLLPFGNNHDDEPQSGDYGCLTVPTSNGLFPDRTLAALSKILEVTGAVVVLSSTWRVRADFREDILAAFRDYGDSFGGPLATMSEFYDLTDVNNHSERQWEIHDWCTTNCNRIRYWVALDDEELVQGDTNLAYRSSFVGRVIKTESSIGLTMKDAQQAIKLFKKQQTSPR